MNSRLTCFLRSLIFCTFLSLLQLQAYASHILGGELFYKHVSGNTYKITFVIYADCSPAFASARPTFPTSHPQICVYDGDTSIQQLTLAIQSPTTGKEATTLCNGDTSQCTNLSSTIPGIIKFAYSGNVSLPYSSAIWRFVFTGNMGSSATSAGRSGGFTNISSGGMLLQLIDTLNNSMAPNSSPILSDSLQTTFCINQHSSFNPNPIDPDGDSLAIFLSPATNGTGACGSIGGPCTYVGTAWPGMPISATLPLQVVDDSFRIDHQTGQMSFFPNVFQRADINYNIREYRSGILVGTSQHEFALSVLTCPGNFPCLIDSCNGTPVAGAIHTTFDAGCIPLTSTLSLTGASFGLGITYQWQSSPDSITWTNIPGATNDTLQATVSLPSYFRAIVACIKSAKSDTSAIVHIAVDTPSIPIVSLSATPGINIVAGQYDTLTASVTGAVSPTYKWLINNAAISGATSATFIRHTFANNDSVTCVVTNNVPCGYASFNSITLNVSGFVGIAPLIDNEQIMITPNPNKGIFTIKGYIGNSNGEIAVEITNAIGQAVYKNHFIINNNNINGQIDVSHLPGGIYFLKINGTAVKRFLKE